MSRNGQGKQTGSERAALEAAASTLERAPSCLAGRTASEPVVVRWVFDHIDHPAPDPEHCPSPGAWTLLRQCREQPGFLAFFIEKLWAKLIPSRAQLEEDRGHEKLDGQAAVDLIDRIREVRDMFCGVAQPVEQESHNLQVEGPSPSPAINHFDEFDGEDE